MVQAIVFDLDGVLVDSDPLHYQAFVQVARRYGIDFDYSRYLQRYVGYDDRVGFRTMFADRVESGVELESLSVSRVSLEDVYLSLTDRTADEAR